MSPAASNALGKLVAAALQAEAALKFAGYAVTADSLDRAMDTFIAAITENP